MTAEQILAHLRELKIEAVVTADDHLLVHPGSRLPRWLFVEMVLAKAELKRLVMARQTAVPLHAVDEQGVVS